MYKKCVLVHGEYLRDLEPNDVDNNPLELVIELKEEDRIPACIK